MVKWSTQKTKYRDVELLQCGLIPVGTAGYNPSRNKGDGPENQYCWELTVPGKARKGKCETLVDAKAAAEAAFAEWLEKAGLVAK